jgi:hypothetical protein
MPSGLERARQPLRYRKATRPPAFRDRDVTAPVRPFVGEPTGVQINVDPFERDDFAEPKSRIAAQQHHEVRLRASLMGHRQQPFVLVLPLEVVLENHAPDAGALLAEAPLGAQIRAVERGIVDQLTGPVNAGVERLVPFVIAVAPVRAEQVASPLGQRHGPLATVEQHRSNQALIAEVAKIVLSRLKRCIARIAQVALGHDTERTRGGEAAAVLAVELVAVNTVQNDLSFESTRELKTVQEDVAGVVLTRLIGHFGHRERPV